MSAVLVNSPKFHKGLPWHNQEDQTPEGNAVTSDVELQALADERSLHAHAFLLCSSKAVQGGRTAGASALATA